jgi:hypothetical protein
MDNTLETQVYFMKNSLAVLKAKFSIDHRRAASGDAIIPRRARLLAGLSTWLHSLGALLLGAIGRQFGFADTNLTMTTFVETGGHWSTLTAVFRLGQGTIRAADETIDARLGLEFATSEAVAAIGHQRQAEIQTLRALGLHPAVTITARTILVVITWILRHRFVIVAAMIPMTIIVSRSSVLIEIAFLSARRAVSTRNFGVEAGLVVVAGPETIRILGIDQAVIIIVLTIAAGIKMALTIRNHALVAVPSRSVGGHTVSGQSVRVYIDVTDGPVTGTIDRSVTVRRIHA